MKKLFVAVVLFSIGGLPVTEEVRVGVFAHAPNVYQNAKTHEPYGPSVDYIKAVLKEMGYAPVVLVMPLPRVLKSLESGDLDVSLEMGKTAEREAYLLYPNNPVYRMRPALAFLATNKISKINSLDDIRGMTIGFLYQATAVGDFFSEDPAAVRFERVAGENWLSLNLSKLLAGRVDAVMDQNPYSYLAEAKSRGVAGKIKVIELPGKGIDAYVVFSKKSARGRVLLNSYNRVSAKRKYDLNKMIEHGLRDD